MTTETPIMRETLVAVSNLPESMFWRNNTGVAITMDGKRHIRFGLNGSGDIIGALRGRPVAIETKTKDGSLDPDQKRFRRAWEKAGGVYIVARSPAEALDQLRGLSS